MLPTTIYLRTQAGRDEIYSKQAGLTQSERQVLIMIDGVTPYQGVRDKLSALTDERFERAVRALLKKELISEVFLPVAGQEAEQIETTVVARFLQQEPTDPITIISYDPEEEFGDLVPSSGNTSMTGPIPELDVVVAPVPAVDEVHARMADSLQEELQARHAERRQQIPRSGLPVTPPEPRPAQLPPQSQAPDNIGMHWGYWLIGLGIAFIVGFVIARFTAR